MPITVPATKAQANLDRYVRDLESGVLDKVIITDGHDGASLAEMVAWSVYAAADPGLSAHIVDEPQTAYNLSASAQGKSLYRLIKRIRDEGAAGVAGAVKATADVTFVAKANLVDGETFTLVDAEGNSHVFEFDVAGDGATDIQINISGDTTADEVAATAAGVIASEGFGVSVAANIVTVTQTDPGEAGNQGNSEAVADGGFTIADFTGGADAPEAGGPTAIDVYALKRSKNDATRRAAIVPASHAAAIGL